MQDSEENRLAKAWRQVGFIILALVIAFAIPVAIVILNCDVKVRAASDALASRIASESGGKITLTDFQKTDGQAEQIVGIEGYGLTFTGTITFGADGFWETHYMGSPFSFNFSPTGTAFGGLNGETRIHAGNQVKISGRLDGQRSERGWHFDLTSCQIAQ